MKSLSNATNGFMIISDSFITAIFKQSFLRTLNKDEEGFLKMGYNGTFEVLVSAAAIPTCTPSTCPPMLRDCCWIVQRAQG
jgi:hypothetical protein